MATEVQVCKLGSHGQAYDGPEVKRAYTYVEQPNNSGAYKLGRALVVAASAKYGDSIDQGLNLLKALHDEGFGVFEIKK